MSHKRKSLVMDERNWEALNRIAADCDCVWRGEPSWRRLLTSIARGAVVVMVRDKYRLHARRTFEVDIHEKVERERLYSERRRREAGIPPRGAQEALDEMNS
jgi:hypothetical protein